MAAAWIESKRLRCCPSHDAFVMRRSPNAAAGVCLCVGALCAGAVPHAEVGPLADWSVRSTAKRLTWRGA